MPAPAKLPLPAAIQTLFWVLRPVELMRWCTGRYGDTYRMDLTATNPCAMTGNPEYVRTVFTGDTDALRAGEVNSYLGPLLGETSLVLLDGARHVRQRRLMLPPFRGERMRAYADTMRDVTLARMATWRDDTPFALRDEAQAITFELILRTVFGVTDPDEIRTLEAPLLAMLKLSGSPIGSLNLIPALRIGVPGSPWWRFLRVRAQADVVIHGNIEARRRHLDEGRNDILSLLLAAKDDQGEAMSASELRDELMTLLIVGHETTATAITWALERLLANPAAYAHVQRELREVCGGEPPSADDLSRLEYLDATIREALRMRPVLPLAARQLHVPLQLGPHEIPAGWIVAPSTFMAHHNPSVYPEPFEFRPERFLGVKPDPYAWFPFGGGSRRCLGMSFALYEMKTVIATMLSRKHISLAQRAPVAIERSIVTFTPAKGLRITCKPLAPRSQPAARASVSALE